jgi:hypothetical protein
MTAVGAGAVTAQGSSCFQNGVESSSGGLINLCVAELALADFAQKLPTLACPGQEQQDNGIASHQFRVFKCYRFIPIP